MTNVRGYIEDRLEATLRDGALHGGQGEIATVELEIREAITALRRLRALQSPEVKRLRAEAL